MGIQTELATQDAKQTTKVVSVVGFYFAISISLVFLNKVLLTDEGGSIPAPLFVTWFQCAFTVALFRLLATLREWFGRKGFFAQFPDFELDTDKAKQVLPLSLVFVGMVTFNNLCLKYVEVSFYNVARSLTLVFNLILSRYLLGEWTSRSLLVSVSAVVIGFILGSGGEINFSFLGTSFGVLSSIFVSLNSILTKSVLPAVDNDKWLLQLYNNVNACLLFPPLIALSGEIQTIQEHADLLMSWNFWVGMTTASVFGFAIGLATILQIQVTSPLTHNISGTAKAALQTALAFAIWKNPTNAINVVGIALVLVGSLHYAYVRHTEAKLK